MTASVQVIMQAQKEFPADMGACRDKFLVQALALASGEDFGPDTFRAGVATKDTKIRVALEGPPAPPSPVPEVNETEEDSSLLAAGAAGAGAGALAGRALGGGSDGAAAAGGGAGGLSQENRVLRSQVERLMSERDQMRRQLDAAGRGGGGKGGAAAVRGGGGGALSPAMVVIALLLAALAFLVGHYAHELVPGGLPLPTLEALNLKR
jgi:outer membrane murein-binding lipoprotein Lpp